MKTIIAFLLSLATAIAAFFGSTTPFRPEETTISSTAQTSLADLDYRPDKESIDLFNAINDIRESSGEKPLILDNELCRLSRIRAEEQPLRKGPCST